MYLSYADKEQLNVAIGDIVDVHGNRGIVTEVHHGYFIDTYNNAPNRKRYGWRAYVDVRVHFLEEDLQNTVYDNSFYGLFHVIKKGGK